MSEEVRHEIMRVEPDEDLSAGDVSLDVVRSGLESEDNITRTHAAKVAATLGSADPDAVSPLAPDLVAVLDDERNVVAFQAGIALACIAEVAPERLEDGIPELTAMLSHEFPDVRELAARALATVAQDHPEFFVDHVDHLVAAAALEPENVLDPEEEPDSGIQAPTAESPVRSLNKEKRVQQVLARETAANLVVEVGEHDPGALEPHADALVGLLDDRDLGVATAAAAALGSLASANPEAVAEADGIEALRDLLDEDDDQFVATAVRALGFVGDPVVVDDLRALAEDEERDDDLRDLAAETADFLERE